MIPQWLFSIEAIVICATVALGSHASNAADADGFVVRNARIFDGKQVIPRGDVWVEGGKIKSVGPGLEVPDEVKEIAGDGNTLLPGLIDAHAHASPDGLKSALVFGVTTELDMFMEVGVMQRIKQEQAAGQGLDRADLRSSGTLATAPEGHGTEYGLTIPTLSSPAEAAPWVHARIQEGSDYIKIVYDDATVYGGLSPTLSKETMKAVIDAAHAGGKLAVIHIGSQKQARDAIEAGADGLAHLFIDSAPESDFASFVAKHLAFVVPTLSVLDSVSGSPSGVSLTTDSRLEPYLLPAEAANLKQPFPKFPTKLSEKYAEQAVRELMAVGVPVLAGTDAPNPGTSHGESMHRELELLVRAGMTPAKALTAATSAPAAAFHLDDRGEIAPGKRADLVLVKGDPTEDITATRVIVAVWKSGIQADRKSYAAAIAKQRLEAATAKQQPASSAIEAGLISDFEDGKASASFGGGWSISTDSIMGGKSSAEMKPVESGAQGSKHALEVSGEIAGGLPFAWGGVMFSPGAQVFAPADVSSKKELAFSARGDGQTYRVMIFTEGGGRIPAQQTFVAGKDWQQHSFPLSDFNGTDGHDLAAILFVGGPAAGKFQFQIDDIRLK